MQVQEVSLLKRTTTSKHVRIAIDVKLLVESNTTNLASQQRMPIPIENVNKFMRNLPQIPTLKMSNINTLNMGETLQSPTSAVLIAATNVTSSRYKDLIPNTMN